MRIDCVSADIRSVKADMVVVNLFEGTKRPGGAAAHVDAAIGGAIAAAVRDGDFAGKLGETLSLRPSNGLSSPRVLVVGLGKKEKFTADHA
ncbi:MAG TPA: M17 family peptidase N-terminal domain-containing protein, partial [Patescibacteria group bacterium]|nr:M17 family peptidase N-terminal domain-containing protein [Patescibacteria group bacterium]